MKEFNHIPCIIGFMSKNCDPDLNINEFFRARFPDTREYVELLGCSIETPFGAAGLIKRNVDDISRSDNAAFNEYFSVLFEGEFFSGDGRRQDATWLLELVTNCGIKSLNTLNGNYMLAVYDVRENLFILRSDRYATRSLYYSYENNALMFSNDFRTILKAQPRIDSINFEAILDFIDFEFILNNETFHSSIKVLGHGEQLVYDGHSLCMERYWDYPSSLPYSKNARPEDFSSEAYSGIKRAISRRITGRPSVGVTLSCGLDSRSIAAFVASMSDENLLCYHLGEPDHKHSKWAEDICKSIGGVFENIAFVHLEFDRLLKATYHLLAGQVCLNQAILLWLLSALELQNIYILDGQVQDALLRPLYIDKDLPSNINEDDYEDLVLKYFHTMPLGLLSVMLKYEWTNRVALRRKDRILQHMQGRIFEDKAAFTQHFYLTTRGQRYVWGSPVLEYSLVDIGFPGMDYDLFDWAMQIPVELRGPDASIYRTMICKYLPEVSQIPWDATEAPLNIYKGRIKHDYSIKGKEFWYYLIRRISHGKMDLFRNFLDRDRLFRKNTEFREALLEPISFIDSYASSPIAFDAPERLTGMIMGGRDYFEAIQKIVTVLNYFQICAE